MSDIPPAACPICGKVCANTSSLRRHLKRTHPDAEIEVPSSPKKMCTHCGKTFSDIKKHQKICKKAKKSLPQERLSDSNFNTMTNSEFIQYLRSYWMRPGSGLSPTTVKLYVSKLKLIVGTEEKENPGFLCRWWLDPDGDHFQTLKEVDMYCPPEGYGQSNMKQVNTYFRKIDFP